jgi:hypothetical protein
MTNEALLAQLKTITTELGRIEAQLHHLQSSLRPPYTVESIPCAEDALVEFIYRCCCRLMR